MGYTMNGFSGFGNSPAKQTDDEKTIGGESLSELITQGRVVDAPSESEGGTDYTYTDAGKTSSGKSKIKITGKKGAEGGKGTGGKIGGFLTEPTGS